MRELVDRGPAWSVREPSGPTPRVVHSRTMNCTFEAVQPARAGVLGVRPASALISDPCGYVVNLIHQAESGVIAFSEGWFRHGWLSLSFPVPP